ncbi:hypothetical protein [Geminicoccus roseus]|uniref:hypothetical protein n=1 Tax=Geminicoccus roseus TaxID=404900 RepID=UPI0003F8CC43|nr:hypothetical protein [Geminicoccus roseus]
MSSQADRAAVCSGTLLASLLVLIPAGRAMALQQQLDELARRAAQAGRSFHDAWGIPGLLVCLGLGLICLPLVRALPKGAMLLVLLLVPVLLFVLSDAILAAGGRVSEMFGWRPAP